MTDTVSPPLPGSWQEQEALRSLSVAYAAAADARDGEGFAALFALDGVLVVPRYPEDLRPVVTRAGPESLRRVPEGLRRFERTFHQVTNWSFTIDGNRASGDVSCSAHHLSAAEGAGAMPGGPAWTDTVWFIRYRDEYVRVGAGWRFARRVLHLQWVEAHDVERVGASQAGGTGTGGIGPT